MQDRFAGDIGDYLKLALLRAVSPGFRVGVAWWLVPDEDHDGAGGHVAYSYAATKWQHIDPLLFDGLRALVREGKRSVADLEALDCIPGCRYASEPIPTPIRQRDRAPARREWFTRVLERVAGCDMIFVDPDNGLEPATYSPQSLTSSKSVTYSELRALAENGRCVIVYHHQTRRPGGHHAEIDFLADRLRTKGFERVDAIRARPYSPRVFFILNAPDAVAEGAAALASRHPGVFSWHEHFKREESVSDHSCGPQREPPPCGT